MNDVYLKEQFRQWISDQIEDNGKKYSQDVQKSYIYALGNSCSEIKNLNLDNSDLFTVNSLDEFKTIEEAIRNSKGFLQVNKKSENANLSEAMLKYAEFLSSIIYKGAVAWFVGSIINKEDQIQRFLDRGIWENGYGDKYKDLVNSIKIGDRIAIKSSYTRKKNLPFDNQGDSVSVMGIKAIGVVIHNFSDGKKLAVEWEMLNPIKEWYFCTSRSTIWRVTEENSWIYKNLMDFTFNKGNQQMDKFINLKYSYKNMLNRKVEVLFNSPP